ncbi:glycosyltransferase [Picosynechococcus sp. PCC 73109]|uniref:glycosyltransferase n=1 Tax=Picosynechococcus sp. PCC 73109 TaxID=374982 RepID=UPI0007458AB2|nr:glycosyltransferase [Picosynechococcus sp. PCC 73109]AMA09223.1 glycosyl transferase family 1 [Picosynechococcus sp. PCC 73109]
MKVLHIIPSIAAVRGGPSKAVIEMVNSLQNAGCEVDIATTNDNGENLLDVPLGRLQEYQGVPVRFFARFSPRLHAVREFAFSAGLMSWLWRNIQNYDLVHVHAIFSFPSTVAMAIARFKNVPYIVRPLGQLCQWSLQQSQRKKQFYLGLIERANLNHAKAIHFTAEAEYVEAQELELAAPGIIIPHGLTIPPKIANVHLQLRQWLHLPEDEPIILFLSRIHPKKGLEILIQALAQLVDQRFTFVIAGSGDPNYENEIYTCLQQSGIGDRTRMLGFIEGEKKDLLLQGADLFTLTSYSENFGIAVLEALAAGLPCVVTPGVALSEIVKQQDLGIVPEMNEAAITTAIRTCLLQPEVTKEKGDRARQFIVENYTWDKIAANLVEIYDAIIQNQPLSHLHA